MFSGISLQGTSSAGDVEGDASSLLPLLSAPRLNQLLFFSPHFVFETFASINVASEELLLAITGNEANLIPSHNS